MLTSSFTSSGAPTASDGDAPDLLRPARDLFGLDSNLMLPVFSRSDEHVPPHDPD